MLFVNFECSRKYLESKNFEKNFFLVTIKLYRFKKRRLFIFRCLLKNQSNFLLSFVLLDFIDFLIKKNDLASKELLVQEKRIQNKLFKEKNIIFGQLIWQIVCFYFLFLKKQNQTIFLF